jgi:predicted transcriptional regulator
MLTQQQGFPAVSSTGGASTFRREWVELFNQVKKVYICYDTDEAGRVGALRVASILREKAFIVRLPSPENGKVDLTDYFGKLSHSADDFRALLQTAQNLPVEETPIANLLPQLLHGFEVRKFEGSNIELVKDGITFAVRVRKKQETVGLTLSKDGAILHQDNLKLQSHKRRKQFSSEVSQLSEHDRKTLENDLLQLGLVVNELTATNVKPLAVEEKPLNQNEVDAATTFLRSPRLMFEIVKEVRRLGVIGEERNALLIYLTITSRITDDPLSLTVKGSSSAGKSFVITKVILLFPPDAYKDLTDATPQSFYYLNEDALAHKTVIIFEIHGSQKADYAIRSLQSEGKLKIQSTIKNEETGQFEAQEKIVNGPTGFISTTTKPNIHPENETRNFTIYPDETEKQTARILESANNRYLGAAPASQPSPALVNLQKVLRPYPVVIDFAKELSDRFPKDKIRARRDYKKLLSLIENIALLHQEQRQTRAIGNKKWLVATLADYYIAQVLFEEILAKTIQEIHPTTEFLLEKAKDIAQANLSENGQFTVRMLAKETGWNDDTVNKWLKPAVNKGYVEVVEESKGRKGAVYKLSDKELELVIVMPKVEELYQINPNWLYSVPIYHPFTGEALSLQPTTASSDVPTLENLIEVL